MASAWREEPCQGLAGSALKNHEKLSDLCRCRRPGLVDGGLWYGCAHRYNSDLFLGVWVGRFLRRPGGSSAGSSSGRLDLGSSPLEQLQQPQFLDVDRGHAGFFWVFR